MGGSVAPLNHLFAYGQANPLRNMDPDGLYSVIPPDTDHSPEIHHAMKDVLDTLSKEPCCAGEDGKKALDVMKDPSLVIAFNPSLKLCAQADPWTKVITLGPLAFTKACCSLASTLLHELVHVSGYYSETPSSAAELDCFGCKPTGFPQPDPFVPKKP